MWIHRVLKVNFLFLCLLAILLSHCSHSTFHGKKAAMIHRFFKSLFPVPGHTNYYTLPWTNTYWIHNSNPSNYQHPFGNGNRRILSGPRRFANKYPLFPIAKENTGPSFCCSPPRTSRPKLKLTYAPSDNTFTTKGHNHKKPTAEITTSSIGTTTARIQSTEPDLNILECGTSTSMSDANNDDNVPHLARILNGENTRRNEIPWRCYLRTPTRNFLCGCSIVSNSWVLTAAHCIRKTTPEEYIIVAGSWNIGSRENQSVSSNVDRVVRHQHFNSVTVDNDISLLHLKEPLEWTSSIRPVCLPWNLEGNNCESELTNVTVSGWGTTSSDLLDPSEILQKVELPCLSTERCRKFYAERITNNMICTYSSEGKDACQLDSGGSIDYKDEVSGRYFAIGIVSWGKGCGELNQPGVYTKVTNYLKWIRTTISTD